MQKISISQLTKYLFQVIILLRSKINLLIDCFVERREGYLVSEVRLRENESLESALKRFKRQCAKSGVLAEARKHEHYEKPSVKRKKKAEAARKRKY